jgi:hypothetical protein
MKWTEAMEEEFKIAKEYLELACEDDISECRTECETERDLKMAQVKNDISNSVHPLIKARHMRG